MVTLDANNKNINTTLRSRGHCKQISTVRLHAIMSKLTVAGGVNVVGQLRYCHLESRLDGRHHLLISLRGHVGNGETFGTETASTTKTETEFEFVTRKTMNSPDTVEIAVCIRRAVVVDDDVDTLNIDTTAEDVSRHEDTLLEGLECRVAVDTENLHISGSVRVTNAPINSPLLLSQTGVDADRREIARNEEFV